MLGLLSIVLLFLASSQEPDTSEMNKADTLRAFSTTQNNIISFNTSMFNEFVLDDPRPYTLFLLFTTTSSKFKCTSCKDISKIYAQIANSYKEAGGDVPSISASGQEKRVVFFAVLEYTQQTHKIYQKFGIDSIPIILVTHPGSIQNEGENFSVSKEDLLKFMADSEVSAERILEFINNRTSRLVKLKTSYFEFLVFLFYSLLFLAILCYAGYVLKDFLLIPEFWFAGGMLVYIISIAGVVYDIVHKVPLAGTGPKGELELIHSGKSSQYGFEGFLMSFYMSIGGISLICINISAKLKNPLQIRIVSWAGIGLLLYSIFIITQIYKLKASWYSPSMHPPPHYIKGPLIRDQGNSF